MDMNHLTTAIVAARDVLWRAPANSVFTSSFGLEDMVLLDMIAEDELPIRVITLDTGRLPEETHALIDRARKRYEVEIDVFLPDADDVEGYVRAHGANAFYDSVPLRQSCCDIRKVRPLARALAGRGGWVTGLRRAQSVTRTAIAVEAFDREHGLLKMNPLAEWSDAQVRDFVKVRGVPYNPLHDRGYPSIGCAPCTRAVEPGEDPRAGRWWWERADSRECGLHRRPLRALPPIVEKEVA
jgi:phosphoadenosine phosphosulfate reductase